MDVGADFALILAIVEGVSILENASGGNGAVVTGDLNVWFDDEVVIIDVDVGFELVSLPGMIGRLAAVAEVLTVLENNGVEDAVFVSTSESDIVVLNCCVTPVTKASGTDVEIIPATAELLSEVKLPGGSVLDDKKVMLATAEGSAD